MRIPRYQNAITIPKKDILVIDKKSESIVAMFVEEFKREGRSFCKELNSREDIEQETQQQVAATYEESNVEEGNDSQDSPSDEG